jgi:NIMA (never in mitosis gene a)-related kinase
MPSGDYERLECVGKGNQGSVYRVVHRVSGQPFVLKRADLDADDDTLRAASLKEADTLGSLQHACVVRYEESFVETEGEKTYLCIVMEYCAGGDLHRRVEQAAALAAKGIGAPAGGAAGVAPPGYFPEGQVMLWFVQIALALHHVHVRRLLHRDLKTQNVFVCADGLLKLGDFGIARVQRDSRARGRAHAAPDMARPWGQAQTSTPRRQT